MDEKTLAINSRKDTVKLTFLKPNASFFNSLQLLSALIKPE